MLANLRLHAIEIRAPLTASIILWLRHLWLPSGWPPLLSACSDVFSAPSGSLPHSAVDTHSDTRKGVNLTHTTFNAMATQAEGAEVTTAAVSSKGSTIRFQKVRPAVLSSPVKDTESVLTDKDHHKAKASESTRQAACTACSRH